MYLYMDIDLVLCKNRKENHFAFTTDNISLKIKFYLCN